MCCARACSLLVCHENSNREHPVLGLTGQHPAACTTGFGPGRGDHAGLISWLACCRQTPTIAHVVNVARRAMSPRSPYADLISARDAAGTPVIVLELGKPFLPTSTVVRMYFLCGHLQSVLQQLCRRYTSPATVSTSCRSWRPSTQHAVLA